MKLSTSDKHPARQRSVWAQVRWSLIIGSVALAGALFGGCNPAAQDVGSKLELVEQLVDAACGECQFNLPGNSCDLAIRVEGQAYFVDGSSIDDHGDAHAADGLCNAIRRAKVTGTIQNGRFQASKFELLDK